MNEEIKAQWIAALRSGRYPQGAGSLCRSIDDKKQYCCLGVLSELAVLEGIIESPTVRHFDKYTELEYAGYVSFLCEEVRDWSGMSTSRGAFSVEDGEEPVSLDRLNDGGFTFDQIADVINYFF